MMFYQKQNVALLKPGVLRLSKMIDIYVYNGDIRPAPGQTRLVMVVVPMAKNTFSLTIFLF